MVTKKILRDTYKSNSSKFTKKINQGKDSMRKAKASASDMKDITGGLITKSSNLLNSLISQNNKEGDIFHSFKISKNKALIAAAAYFLGSSYKFLQEKKTSKNFLNKKIFDNERIFTTYAAKLSQNLALYRLEPFSENFVLGCLKKLVNFQNFENIFNEKLN